MQHLRTINLIVLLSALLCLAQTVTAESAKTTAKTTPQFIKGAVKPIATKNLVAPMLHKKEATSEKKATQAKVVPKAIPKVVPKAALKVVPQPAKKSSQPPDVAKKMPKPFDSRNAVKAAAGAKVKAGSGLLKQAVPPDRKPQPNTIIKGIPGITGNSQMGVSKKAVAPVGAVKPANPASSRGGFQGLAKSREKVQPSGLTSKTTLPAVQKAQQPVKLLQTGPADGLRVPISGGGAHLAPGVQLPDGAQAQPRMQGIPPPELREGLVLARENLRADLQIFEITRIPSGRDRGKIAISVKAIPRVAGNQAPLESFPIRLWMGGIGNTLLWEGRGQIKNILGAFVDRVVTSHVLDSRPQTLTAEVNVSNMDSLYPESCPREARCNRFNTNIYNRYSQNFNIPTPPARAVATRVQEAAEEIRENNTDGSGDFETRIRSFRQLRKGSSWVEFEIIYDLRKYEPDRWLEPGIVFKYGRRAYFSTYYTNNKPAKLRCSSSGTGPGISPGGFGQGRRYIFMCQLASSVTSYSGSMYVGFKRQDEGHFLTSGRLQFSLEQPVGESSPVLWIRPDFDITNTRISYREGKPTVLRVEVENIRHVPSPEVINPLFVPILLKFKNQVDGVVARRYYRMRLDTIGRGTLRISLAGRDAFEWRADSYRHGTGTIEVEVNAIGSPERALGEVDINNNTARVEVTDYAPRYR